MNKKSIKKTVIAHFYNEEYMLPYWLDHHKKIFDCGVMINNNSTDASVEIIKRIAPDWKIIDSKLDGFDPLMLDFLVQKVEEQCESWKICLNISEFLYGDIDEIISSAEKNGMKAIATTPIIMIDPTLNEELLESKAIVDQKPYGVHGNKLYDFLAGDQKIIRLISLLIGRRTAFRGRSRLLHCNKIGGYTIGRHNWYHESVNAPNIFVLWYGYSPWTDGFLERKLSFKKTLLKTRKELGAHHAHGAKRHKINYILHKIYLKLFGFDVRAKVVR